MSQLLSLLALLPLQVGQARRRPHRIPPSPLPGERNLGRVLVELAEAEALELLLELGDVLCDGLGGGGRGGGGTTASS